MENQTGICEIEFADDAGIPDAEIAEIINGIVKPNRPIKPEDIHVRTMFVTSDGLNSQGGRFGREEIERLCELIPGAPVLVGHNKRQLPIGRCFKSEIVERNGGVWVKVWFYWLRAADGSGNLVRNIDGGIYSECSLGFNFRLPECSICRGDIRKCSHIPGREYTGASGRKDLCHFVYRSIVRVNEISLVYRGAVPGTAISDLELDACACPCADRIALSAFGTNGILLLVETEALRQRQIAFPNCPKKLLDRGRTVIGHQLTGRYSEQMTATIDAAVIEVVEHTAFGLRFRSFGWFLNGEYIIRSAILQGEKVMLLSKAPEG